jgi:peptide deformylase
VAARERGTAFLPARGRDLDRVFSIQQERVVNRDNTVQVDQQDFQIEKVRWRGTLAGCRATVWEHLDGRLTIHYRPHVVAAFSAERIAAQKASRKERAA